MARRRGSKNLTWANVVSSCGLLLGIFVGVPVGFFLGRLEISSEVGNSNEIGNGSYRTRGTEGLPPDIIVAETDLYHRIQCGDPAETLPAERPSKYLVTFAVGIKQKPVVNLAVAKFPKEWTIMLFHYDGNIDAWDEFEWSKTAIHVSAYKQTKWWFAKRYMHPDVVAPFDYIFIWDEDLGVEHFDAEEYIKLVRNHGLEISQPGMDLNGSIYNVTNRRDDGEVHKTGFVEIMAPVFSRKAWRCVWHMVQNDLAHGWGLDFEMRNCVEPADEKIGVVDLQWIHHQHIPSLKQQGTSIDGEASPRGVMERCAHELTLFRKRFEAAEKGVEEGNADLSRPW